jgi:alpha-amylase/alpha-mannosidase (GH57 family)
MDNSRSSGTLFLNIIWHQHQPLYVDLESDQLRAPWVRAHGTKDYYDMASILEKYPKIHCNINLTSSLLIQLEQYYVERMKPFVDLKRNRVDTEIFFQKLKGKTDPWIDLALKPTAEFGEQDLRFLLHDVWNALYITDVMINRFPQYKALKEKVQRQEMLSEQELREIKFWFFLAYFDPDFLESAVPLADGTTVDLTDFVAKHSDGTYTVLKAITEEDCNRIVTETYKILANIIPIHRKLMYHPKTHKGQIEVTTTPFYHPILPLLYDSDIAKVSQPHHAMPNRFRYPQDANAQVRMAVEYYKRIFGQAPHGMWPAEGSVAQEIVSLFSGNGILWIATDEKILTRSIPSNQPKYYPYNVSADHGTKNSVAIVFRDTELSDKIGFAYQHYKGTDAADDFIKSILRCSPPAGEPDRLLTVILDGENAWEWYRYDNDGKEFLHSFYKQLSRLYSTKQLITVTASEYILGNPKRSVPPHPITSMRKLQWLYPGSWINANYDTWIGNEPKNQAWNYLLIARQDLEKSGLPPPDPKAKLLPTGTKRWYAAQAWHELYAAEGSDWFWWYGSTQGTPTIHKPFDATFIRHLNNVYAFARFAGVAIPERVFTAIVSECGSSDAVSQGTMLQGRTDSTS